MKISFLLAYSRNHAPKPLLGEVVALLTARGFHVAAAFAESMVVRPETLRVEADLYILKSHSALWLSLAAVLDGQRARILNPYASCVAAMNKIGASHRLFAAGVPVPRSWVTGDLARVADADPSMPVLLKPAISRGGVGIRVVHARAELATARVDDGMLVQEYVASVAEEIKVYVIGERAFAVRKHRETGEREACALDPAVEQIARQCGVALGLGVYGVDVIQSAGGPVVVDANYFPSFRGVPDAAEVLAEYIAGYARGDRAALELPCPV